jgi:hypothetical protein
MWKLKPKKKEEKRQDFTTYLRGSRLLIFVSFPLVVSVFVVSAVSVVAYSPWFLSNKFITFSHRTLFIVCLIAMLGINFYIIRRAYKLIKEFVQDSIREIPADPPHKAILLFLGRRTNKVLDEGWRLLPFYGTIFDAMKVNVTKYNQNLPKQTVKASDLADLEIDINITWSAGSWMASKTEQAMLLNNFINSGERSGVEKIIADIIQNRLRIWAFSKEEGPASWQEAIGAKDDAIAALVKAVLGDDIPSISSDIPTSVLLRYFSSPRKPPLEYQKEEWGRKDEQSDIWQKLEERLASLNSADRLALEDSVKKRQEIISSIKRGNGSFVHNKLGITINLLTIKEVALMGEVAKAVEGRVREKEEREAETTELKHISDRIRQLKKDFPRASWDQVVEMIQTERGKVVKNIHEVKGSGSKEIINLVNGIAKLFVKQ